MSKYPRKRNVFDPDSKKTPYKLSCTQIKLFRECPRCFYLDRRLGIGRPPGFPFTLNLAVDTLLKKEFDCYRDQGLPHPIMDDAGLTKIIPAWFSGEIDAWRNNFKGVQSLHEPTNLLITGAIDDLWWKAQTKESFVVEYKATSRKEPVTEINPAYGYKEQVEVYQWLLRRNGLTVNNTAYFIYANGRKDWALFEEKLHFDMTLIPLECDDSWIEKTITDIHKVLVDDLPPDSKEDCPYCDYIQTASKA